jgi:hypothetical protein
MQSQESLIWAHISLMARTVFTITGQRYPQHAHLCPAPLCTQLLVHLDLLTEHSRCFLASVVDISAVAMVDRVVAVTVQVFLSCITPNSAGKEDSTPK